MTVRTMPLIIIFVILFDFRSISAAEQYPKKGDVGLSIDSSSRVLLKKMVSDDYALSLGMLLEYSHYSSDNNGRNSSFLVGCRNYREKGNYNYFIDLDFAFSHYHDENPYSSYWSQSYSLRAYYGLEHFINKELSLGGRAGISANYYESKNGSGSTRIQFPVSDIALTYYW